jgi:hypothetical protein
MTIRDTHSDAVADRIADHVAGALHRLPFCTRCWLERQVEPRPVSLSLDAEGRMSRTFWVATDHTGVDDAPCRIEFDGASFGLAIALDTGVECFTGPVGSFADVMERR